MPEPTVPKSPADAKKPGDPKKAGAAKPGGAKNRSGPDLATLSGLVIALAGILGGLILEKGSIQDVAQATAALIVFGGTIGAVLITTPLPVFLRSCKAMRHVFWTSAPAASATIDTLIQFASKARKNGIVSLETEAAGVGDPFLRKALGLAVDGTDLQELRRMMETDIHLSEQKAEAEAKVWEAAGGYAPTVGIIGAVMGLIQVMKHLEDIKEVGHGIAVAFVATVYGVGAANILLLPVASKLKTHMRTASAFKEMTLDGVIGIVEGLNPTLIRLKLEAYNDAPPKAAKPQKGKAAEGKSGAGAASSKGAGAAQPASAS